MADEEDQILRWDPEPGEFLKECKGDYALIDDLRSLRAKGFRWRKGPNSVLLKGTGARRLWRQRAERQHHCLMSSWAADSQQP
jgi:hypothetical protein